MLTELKSIVVQEKQLLLSGRFVKSTKTCRICGGTGRFFSNGSIVISCSNCNGLGVFDE